MHELSIAESVVDAVLERTGDRRVTVVRLQTGRLSGVMTMTDQEKAEARATDPRAREIIDRCEQMTLQDLQQLHGVCAIRTRQRRPPPAGTEERMMNPDIPDDQVDTEGKTVPPYEGRRKSVEVDSQEESTKDGAKTAGATGPVLDEEMKGTSQSKRGPTASPSDEQPAAESGGSAPGEASVGPAHQAGVPRGEDRPKEEDS